MFSQILDGKKVAEDLYSKLILEIPLLPVVPKLVVVIVGNDPASESYVRSKTKKCSDLGLQGETISLPDTVTEAELLALVQKLNSDKSVHGILIQLPLPKAISREKILLAVDPMKDVDGLHPENVGKLVKGDPRFVPCTPAGVMEILRFYSIPIASKRAVVLGRSDIVGKPMAHLLLAQDATVTICHSRTQDLETITKQADILVAALGKHSFVQSKHVKPGAVVIDVGIHRVDGKISGDVNFNEVGAVASHLTPVPGGVGPMTIAMLMKNVVLAATLQTRS